MFNIDFNKIFSSLFDLFLNVQIVQARSYIIMYITKKVFNCILIHRVKIIYYLQTAKINKINKYT